MNFSYKHIWGIAYPILISLLMEHLINITDTIFLGHVGQIELGASAIAGVYYMAIYMVGFGFSIGAQIVIARRNGETKHGEIGTVFQTALCALLILAFAMWGFSKLFTHYILGSIVSSEAVIEAATSYLNWRVYGFFFSFTAMMFRAFYIGTTQTKILTLNSLIMVLSNIVLNYMLIFGHWGAPKLGIAGAAIGSTIAELISALLLIYHTWRHVDREKYRLFKQISLRWSNLRALWKVSGWTMLQSVLFPSQWLLFFIAIEHLGERPLAIANIIRSINTCFFMLIIAFADAASSIVGNMVGAGCTKKEINKSISRIIRMTYIIGAPFILLTALFPHQILSLYTDNQSLIVEAYPTIYVMLANFILAVPALILFNVVAGSGNTFQSMKIMLRTMVAYLLYVVVVVLYLRAEIAISWTTEYIYTAMLLLQASLYWKGNKWNKKI